MKLFLFSLKSVLQIPKTGASCAFFVVFLLLVGCEKPNPHPELLDPIYEDLEKKLKSAESDLKAAEKQLDDFKVEFNKVKPQTGQIKFAQKRVYDTESNINKLKQKVEFLTIRIGSRRKYARENYMIAYRKKQPWPNPDEIQEYRAQQALEEAPRPWNAKMRIESAKTPAKPAAGGGHGEGHSDEHAEPAPPEAHH